jgi:hypothetical protein
MSKCVSRKAAKAQRSQRKKGTCFSRFFAPWRLCAKLSIFSQLLAPWETAKKELVGLLSAYAFIERTHVLAKMPLSCGAFKPPGRQSDQ